MHERVSREDDERDQPATPATRAEPPSAQLALQLQRTAGNQATTQMVQRFGIGGGILGIGGDLAFDYAWDKFVDSNTEDASYFAPDPNWRLLALQYSDFNKSDGLWIKMGLARMPDCYKGGWILDTSYRTVAGGGTVNGYFYQVANVTDSGATNITLELETPLKEDVTTAVVLENVITVLERGTSWRPRLGGND